MVGQKKKMFTCNICCKNMGGRSFKGHIVSNIHRRMNMSSDLGAGDEYKFYEVDVNITAPGVELDISVGDTTRSVSLVDIIMSSDVLREMVFDDIKKNNGEKLRIDSKVEANRNYLKEVGVMMKEINDMIG